MVGQDVLEKLKNLQTMTAVEWLIEQLQAPCRGIPSHIIEQAKEIEKQMVIDIVEKSRATGLTAEYLLLTYESKESDDTTLEQIDQNNPVTRGSTALVKKEQKKLITEIMDEDAKNGLYDISPQTELSNKSWEGCDGCTEQDEIMYKNGYIKGYNAAISELPKEISDKEIKEIVEQEYKRYPNNDYLYGHSEELQLAYKAGIWDGIKWYREQLKKKQ